jgi:hypothetical protein
MSNDNSKPKSIKETLKPRRGKIRQGYFVPKNPEKYDGDVTQIIYRSSWEYKFLKFCDDNDKILRYSSEPVGIAYWNPVSKKTCKYWVDAYVALRDSEGNIKKWILEIKPLKYTQPPSSPKRLTEKQMRQYMSHAKAYLINRAKFEAAKDYADSKGIKFGIITENFLYKNL